MTRREFILIADESTQKGPHYSNFFGGLLISSDRIEAVSLALAEEKLRLNLHNEVKWNKTSRHYLGKYIQLVSLFFNFVRSGDVKVRIMFTPNQFLPRNLSRYHRENKYTLLYYQFIKHAFDFRYCDLGPGQIALQIRLDDLPGTPQQKRVFMQYLYALNVSSNEFFPLMGGRFYIPEGGVGEINSRDSDLLQCLDVILGAMQFRLNQGHRETNPTTGVRAGKTSAKDILSAYIVGLVQEIVPDFRPEDSTWASPGLRWKHPYRHWSFKPRNR